MRDDYVQENEALLDSIPVFGKAVLVETRSGAYRGADGEGSVQGYGTVRVYRLPSPVDRDEVADFYRGRLSDWRVVTDEFESGRNRPGVLNFCRDEESLSVNLESDGVLELAADHDAFGKEGHPESCASAGRTSG